VQAWLAPQFARGAIELTLVGDFDPDAAIAAVAATFGALPTREPKPALEELRQLTTPDAPFEKLYRIPTEIPKGVIVLYWPTTDGRDVQRTRRLTVLADVLADRLRVKVREEIGGAYSPGAGSNTSEVYRNLGWITANLTVDPAKAQELTAVTVALADDLCRHGVSEDELNRARLPLLTGIRESLRNNGYWLNLLSRAQEKPEVLDWARTRLADVESITKADLDTLAQSYLGADRVFRVTVLPAQK
jgi:zinc protease